MHLWNSSNVVFSDGGEDLRPILLYLVNIVSIELSSDKSSFDIFSSGRRWKKFT